MLPFLKRHLYSAGLGQWTSVLLFVHLPHTLILLRRRVIIMHLERSRVPHSAGLELVRQHLRSIDNLIVAAWRK